MLTLPAPTHITAPSLTRFANSLLALRVLLFEKDRRIKTFDREYGCGTMDTFIADLILACVDRVNSLDSWEFVSRPPFLSFLFTHSSCCFSTQQSPRETGGNRHSRAHKEARVTCPHVTLSLVQPYVCFSFPFSQNMSHLNKTQRIELKLKRVSHRYKKGVSDCRFFFSFFPSLFLFLLLFLHPPFPLVLAPFQQNRPHHNGNVTAPPSF